MATLAMDEIDLTGVSLINDIFVCYWIYFECDFVYSSSLLIGFVQGDHTHTHTHTHARTHARTHTCTVCVELSLPWNFQRSNNFYLELWVQQNQRLCIPSLFYWPLCFRSALSFKLCFILLWQTLLNNHTSRVTLSSCSGRKPLGPG